MELTEEEMEIANEIRLKRKAIKIIIDSAHDIALEKYKEIEEQRNKMWGKINDRLQLDEDKDYELNIRNTGSKLKGIVKERIDPEEDDCNQFYSIITPSKN